MKLFWVVIFIIFCSILPATSIAWGNLQWPYTINCEVNQNSEDIYGQVYLDGVTNLLGDSEQIIAELGYGTLNSNPSTDNWEWTAATYNTDIGNNDEFKQHLNISQAGQYSYTYRFKLVSEQDWYYSESLGTATISLTPTGLSQNVTVSFNINIGSLNASQIAIQGSESPLNWNIGSDNFLIDDDNNKIYSINLLFEQGSNPSLNYKYTYKNESEEWNWEAIENRVIEIDDSQPTMILDLDYWNNAQVSEINSVTFIDSTTSLYSNFIHMQTLPLNSNLKFECEVDSLDIIGNSGYSVTLSYYINDGNLQTKALNWASNDNEAKKSYWQIELINGTDFFNADSLNFFISATDYNGEEVFDNNNNENYWVKIQSNFIESPSNANLEIVNNEVIITWNEVENATLYKIIASDNPFTDFEQIGTANSNNFSISTSQLGLKKFFKIIAEN